METTLKRFLSLVLAFTMVLSYVPVQTFADEPAPVECAEHQYNTVTTNPTCTEGGYTTHTCSVCGTSYTDGATEALGHSYASVITDPTCTDGGYTTNTCGACGDAYVSDEVAALGHNFADGICSVCGDADPDAQAEDPIETTCEHDYVAGETVAPTCIAEGYTPYTCSKCGDTIQKDKVEAIAHSYEAVVTDPTCTEDGFTTYTCSKCQDSYVADEVLAQGHPEADAEGNCTVCGEAVPNLLGGEEPTGLSGSGTEAAPYMITSAEALKLFAASVNAGEATYNAPGVWVKLAGDIDLDYTAVIIGTKDHPFKGIFDGGKHTISNLTIYENGSESDYLSSSDEYIGLFGYSTGTIKNVTVHDPFIVGEAYVGGIVGCAYTGLVENCHVTGEIDIEGNYMVGGITGHGYAEIKDCSVIGEEGWASNYIGATYVKSNLEGDNVGGIVGHHAENMKLSGCTVKNVTVEGTRKIGGIVGTTFQNNKISDCIVENVIIGTNATEDYAADNAGSMAMGGIIGMTADKYTGGTISGCSVKEVTFTKENDVTVSTGAITGGHRGTDKPVAPTGTTIEDVTTSDVEGATNTFGMPEEIVAVAKIGNTPYASIEAALAAAFAGDTITLVQNLSDVEIVAVKNLTITGNVTLTNVSINANDADELTVSGLTFTGNSWINSGTAEKLTVSGVTANVTPSNATYTNSRSAFISLGRNEGQELALTVENCNIVAPSSTDAILGWAAITEATLTGNTFGSASVYQNNGDSVKFMAIADGAVFNITGNTVYSNYNGIVLAQNTTRGNAYTANFADNTFVGSADHIWIEISGGDTCHATVNAASSNTVNGNTLTASDIKAHTGAIKNWSSYVGVDVVTDEDGKVIGGNLAFYNEEAIADGYAVEENGTVKQEFVKVAKVGDVEYTDLLEAIKAAAPAGTVELLSDVTVDKWIMFSEILTIGDGTVITLDINGLTIDGNDHTLTIKEVESANNGNHIFYDGDYNVCDLTIVMGENVNGLGITSGTISNVTFIGGHGVSGGAAIFVSDGAITGVHAGNVTIEGCTFKNNGGAICYETAQNGLVVNDNTFKVPAEANVILLRGTEQFTNNIVVSGRTVNVVSGSPTVTGNNFGNVRLKVYNEATATISNNTINNLVFDKPTEEAKATFSDDNTLSESAQDALEAVTPKYVAKVGDVEYKTLGEALQAAAATQDLTVITLAAGEHELGNVEFPAILKNVTIKGAAGKTTTIKNSKLYAFDGSSVVYEGIIFDSIVFDDTQLVFTGNRNGEVVYKDWTITDCEFKNVVSTNATSAVHFNNKAGETFENFTFTNNVIDGVTGENVSGLRLNYATGEITITGNEISNAAWNAVQLINVDAEKVTIEGNTLASGADEGILNLYNVTAETLTIQKNKFLVKDDQPGVCHITNVDVSGNYWGGEEPANLPDGVTYKSYYADAEMKNLVELLSGNGTESDPYLINSLEDLQLFRDKVNAGDSFKGKHVKLTADIDLASQAWTPIGNATNKFLGTFDGDNHTISNLVVNADTNNVGLFGFASVIKNVKIHNAKVAGVICVGALAGELESSVGTVENCHVTGTIQITGENSVGGLVGKGYANIRKSSVTGDDTSFVEGVYGNTEEGDNIGGLIGHLGEGNTLGVSNSTVTNITVKGTRKVGGLVGTTARGNDYVGNKVVNVIVECTATADYANANASTTTIGGIIGNYFGSATSGGILKDSTVQNVTFILGNGKSAGALAGGDRNNNGGAPVGVEATSNTLSDIVGATNEYLVPWDGVTIKNLDQLKQFRDAVNRGDTYAGKTVTLTADIDLASVENWEPIGTKENPFKGNFDGNDKTISNLVVSGENNVGFFGYADGCSIKNLKINNATVTGTDCVGAIAGQVYSTSTIDNCHVSGSIQVTGQTNVGGIVGKYYVRVSNSSVIGDGADTSYVKGVYVKSDFEGDNIGGIMGHGGESNNFVGNTVKNITISGTRKIGGIVGTTTKATNVTGCAVENVKIVTTADATYSASKADSMGLGGLIGHYYGNEYTGGKISDSTVKSVIFEIPEGITAEAGVIVGNDRTNVGKEPTGVTVSGITTEEVTGITNEYLIPWDGETIKNLDQLKKFREAVNAGDTYAGKTVTLAADIDLAGENWTPIQKFNGTFDGDNHIISNVRVVGAGNQGFFAQVADQTEYVSGTVKNVTFNNVTIISESGNGQAGLIADARLGARISNVKLTGKVTIKGYRGVGGIVGAGFPVMDGCSVEAEGTITATYWGVGGILGFASDKGAKVSNSTITSTGNGLTIHGELGGVGAVTGTPHGAATNGATVQGVAITSNNNHYMGYVDASGTVSGDITVEDVAVKVNGEEIIGNDAIASIGTAPYFSLQAAVNAAQENDTITLLRNVTETVTVNKPVTINGNAKIEGEVIVNADVTLTGAVEIEGTLYANAGNLTVSENATVKVSTTFAIYDGAKLTVSKSAALSASSIYFNGGSIEVYGTLTAVSGNDGGFIMNGADDTITVFEGGILDVSYVDIYKTTGNTTASIFGEAKVGFKMSDGSGKFTWNVQEGGSLTVAKNGIVMNNTGSVVNIHGNASAVKVDSKGTMYLAPSAKLTAPEGLTLTTKDDFKVVYADGVYTAIACEYVAEVGGQKYESLAEALTAAKDKETITLIWAEDKAPIAMNGVVCGKTVTITGTATVDWSKGNLWIGRNGTGDGTVTFENANLTSASNSASYGIHVSGRQKDEATKWNGTLMIKNSTIELDYLIQKNVLTLDNSKLTVKNGFSVGGRLANETESGVDATATVTLNNGSELIINNHNGMGLGTEGNQSGLGVMNVDSSSNFETTMPFKITEMGTLNLAGTAKIAGTLTNNGSIVLTDAKATLTATAGLTVTTSVENHEIEYIDGKYTVVRCLAGEGTEASPFLIKTVEDLILFRDSVNAGEGKYNSAYVQLAADIDLASVENWTPIGDVTYDSKYAPADATKVFRGVFDGNGKVISNLKASKTVGGADNDANVGLFGITGDGAVIKNLTLTNVNIETDGRNVGALAAFAYKTTLDNITVKGNIQIKGGNNVAGVCSMTRYYDMSATNIFVKGNDGSAIVGNNIVGGIFAEIAPNGSKQTFKNLSVENVAITGAGGVGGIVGLLTTGTVDTVSVKNVVLTGKTEYQGDAMGRIRLGTVAGLMGGKYATIKNAAVENVTGKNLDGNAVDLPIIGANYDSSSNATEAKSGDTYYATLKDALKDTGAKEIALLTPITVAAGEELILDLNGKTVVGTDNSTKSFALITNKGNLTIKDSVGNGKITLEAKIDSGWERYSSVISNTVGGKLTVDGGTIAHLGGTDMAYAIDNLTNGKGTRAETIINGGTIKSTYAAIRQFLNGVEAENILTINGGSVQATRMAIYFQDPSKNANTGTLTVGENAAIWDEIYLEVCAGSTEWPVEVKVAKAALKDAADAKIVTENMPVGYEVLSVREEDVDYFVVKDIVARDSAGNGYATLQDALNAGGQITLLKDIKLAETAKINAGKTVTLNLNGKKINADLVSGSTTNHIYVLENSGTLTITGDGEINTRGIFNYGTMTLENGTINAIDGNGGYGVRSYAGATFTMNGGTIATTLEDDHKVDKGGYDATTVRVDEGATFVMKGGIINNICDFTFAIDNAGTATIIDGTVTSVHSTVSSYGTLTINGGKFTCNGLEGITAHALVAWDGSKTTINGGTFDGKDNYNGFNVDADKGAIVEIKGGTFLSVHSGSLYGDGTITVSGGTFFDEVKSERLAERFVCVQNKDNMFDVIPQPVVAKIGETPYYSLPEAIEAAADGDTIHLMPGTITETVAPWAKDSQHTTEKSITIIGADNFSTKLTGGLYLGYDDSGCRAHTITIQGIHFEGKGVLVAGQQNVVIDSNKFTGITTEVATGSSANANAISVIGKNVNATVTNNEIDGTATAGINLRNIAAATVTGNTISNTEHNSITVTMETPDAGTLDIKNNTMSTWGTGAEKGRAIRISGGATVTVNGNVMTHTAVAPEEFVKVDPAAANMDASQNYWGGQNPTAENIWWRSETDTDAGVVAVLKNYYTDAEKTNLVDLQPDVAMIGEIGYKTLKKAFESAENGQTIKLIANFEQAETAVNTKTVTLDLNGYTVTGKDSNTSGNFYLINNDKGNLTITDTSVTKSGKITLIAENERNWAASSVVVANNLGVLEVKGGTIEHLGGTSMAYGIDSLTNSNIGEATTTISGGSVQSTYFAVRQFANCNQKLNKLVITGGDHGYIWMQSPNDNANMSETTVTGGTVAGVALSSSSSSNAKVYVMTHCVTDDTHAVKGYTLESGYRIDMITENNRNVWVLKLDSSVAENVQTGVKYETVSAALAAAKSGETVRLLTDCADGYVLVTPGIKLDLNGKQLTASYVVGFETADVIDSSNENTGLLIVDEKGVALDQYNDQLPIWNGEGYVFVTMVSAIKQVTNTGEGFRLSASPCPETCVVDLLKDGAADNNLQIVVRLTWNDGNDIASQDLRFNEKTIAEVYSSYGGKKQTDYGQSFYMTVTGIEGVENLQARIVLKSGTRAELYSTKSLQITN